MARTSVRERITIKGLVTGVLLIIFFLASCTSKTEYEQVKERELKSGKVVEELFLDLRLGMGRKDFYGTCWEHNKNGILTNGAHYLQVLYNPILPSGKVANMHFYPKFEEDHLYYMPIEILYQDWFPTNEEFSIDNLMKDVMAMLEKWYGEGFFEVSNKGKTVSAMVKVDGNRVIRVHKKNINTVRVEILDLRIKDFTQLNKQDEEV
ncbi:hypothetical protein [Mongoliitalea lutea]|nr:hypothetical protein [Mongoliitalea lutea]